MVWAYVLDTLCEQTISMATHTEMGKKKIIGYLINDIMTTCALTALLSALVCTAAILVCLKIVKRKITIN
jgi:hypothetical protein